MKIVLDKKVLLQRIKINKKMMYIIAKNLGFTHPKVVAQSQKVDGLINRYQGIEC